MKAPLLECQQLKKDFSGKRVFDDLDLSFWPGELISLVGPSGSGKTTFLRCLAGLEKVDGGRIVLDGKDITESRIGQLPIVMMFQQPLLFPHLTVMENIVYGLKAKGANRKDIKLSAGFGMLKKIDMEDFAEHYPYQLSGGQQQRVSLARALIVKPQILLLDEPFSNLDAELRATIRSWVKGILQQEGVTALFVTHDQEEAMIMGDRIAVLKAGTIQQTGRPLEVYRSPSSKIVAEFFADGLVFDDSFVPADKIKLCLNKSPIQVLESLRGQIVGKWMRFGKFVYRIRLNFNGTECIISDDQDYQDKEEVLLCFSKADKHLFTN